MNTFSGYIEILIEGEQIPFKFGSNAYGLFCEMHKIEFWQIASSGVFGRFDKNGKVIGPPDMTKLRDLFYCAHQSAVRSKGLQEKLNLFQIGDLMDDNSEITAKLQEAILNSKMLGFTLEELASGDIKETKKK